MSAHDDLRRLHEFAREIDRAQAGKVRQFLLPDGRVAEFRGRVIADERKVSRRARKTIERQERGKQYKAGR